MSDLDPPHPCHAGSPQPPRQPPESVIVHRVDSVGSTNDLARAWLADHPATGCAVWIAGEQTAGRATRGRSWASPRGGLWMSLAMPLGEHPERRLPGLGLRIGLAALRAARAVCPPQAGATLRIRWPNDLIAAGESPTIQKVGGTLIDHISSSVVIGIGINTNNPVPETDLQGQPLRTSPSSLSELSERPIDLGHLESRVIENILQLVPIDGLPPDLKAEIEAGLYTPPEPVTARSPSGAEVRGVIRGVSANHPTVGGLVLEDEQGLEHIIIGGDIR